MALDNKITKNDYDSLQDGLNAEPKSINPKTHCKKCGYDWEAHEFAVPAPYCPSNDEDAVSNRESHKRIKTMFASVKDGTFLEKYGDKFGNRR